MVCCVAKLPVGDKTCSNLAAEVESLQKANESPQKVDPQVLKDLLEEFKELFPDSLPGLPPGRGV